MTASQDLNFRTREEWRNWLIKNHSITNEAWVVIYKKHFSKEGLRYTEAVEEAICFGWIDSKMNRIDENSFRQRFSPRRKNSIWSKSNKERAIKLIEEGKMQKTGYDAIEAGKQSGKWQDAYTAQSVPNIPEDLEKALQKVPTAHRHFHAFPNSAKLTYIHWILSAKRSTTRVNRINQVVKLAKNNVKPH
ncbi:MAG: YdeI/OmpD-associated family protein [Candidatus Bathyarchaeota archaeon]|nr:MAG: YdeI/OmpD-associated family protein [Candidatus Bathyarchaeota archaeon]